MFISTIHNFVLSDSGEQFLSYTLHIILIKGVDSNIRLSYILRHVSTIELIVKSGYAMLLV